jgi:hypothetical protein
MLPPDRPLTPTLQYLIKQVSETPSLVPYPDLRTKIIMLIMARDVDGLHFLFKELCHDLRLHELHKHSGAVVNWVEHCRDVVRIDCMREEQV